MTWEHAFGSQVRHLRQALGWTQADLARRLADAGYPMHQTTVAKMENGTRPTTITEAAALATLFGVSIDVLVGGVAETQVAQRIREARNEVQRLRVEANEAEVRITRAKTQLLAAEKRLQSLLYEQDLRQRSMGEAMSKVRHPGHPLRKSREPREDQADGERQ